MILPRFRELAAGAPETAALIDGESGEVTTRRALLAASEEAAMELRRSGLRAGDAIAVQSRNSAAFVSLFLASLDLELVMAPVDRDATEREIAAILEHFSLQALVRTSGKSLDVQRHAETRGVLPPDARLLKLTSGSTGAPKAIVCTEANLEADSRNICATMGIRPDDRNLGAIPFSHSYGFSNLVTPLLTQGTVIVVTNDYLPQSLLDLANTHHCTVAPLIPMVFEHLASAATGEFETVRTFISAGAPLTAATSRRFRERFGTPIHTFFGCSECGGITYDRSGGSVERGTVGAALAGVQLTMQGERLSVRGENVAAGFLLDANTYAPLNGEFVTDDLVEIREGEVVLTGRSGDLINTAGKKVNPREIESVILELEGALDVRAYGEPAGARGEVVAAAVVASGGLTAETVRQHCLARLAPHKVPRIVKIVDRLPLDERGKVKRTALRAL